jgi:hypothetical protein
LPQAPALPQLVLQAALTRGFTEQPGGLSHQQACRFHLDRYAFKCHVQAGLAALRIQGVDTAALLAGQTQALPEVALEDLPQVRLAIEERLHEIHLDVSTRAFDEGTPGGCVIL